MTKISHAAQAPADAQEHGATLLSQPHVDAYFSADVETDGPIPGRYSLLSFALVYAGSYDGRAFERPDALDTTFYREVRPISQHWQAEALEVNRIDRKRLEQDGADPATAMTEAAQWVRNIAAGRRPILVAYPVSFDWTWLYWYFIEFSKDGSPFNHSGCYDLKTAFAVKGELPISLAGRDQLLAHLRADHPHTHHALEDAIEQAAVFANIFEWNRHGR
ncbi:MAG: exonuclease [Acidobacteria bacterium]|nr:exonuclease [Acidobacteriota bacterium]